MNHCQAVQTARRFSYAAGAAAATVLTLAFPAEAARIHPKPENPTRTSVVVERIEVPVLVDDTAAEVVQMQLAAAAAAIVAAAVTKARLRRRYEQPTGSVVIDITDPRVLEHQP